MWRWYSLPKESFWIVASKPDHVQIIFVSYSRIVDWVERYSNYLSSDITGSPKKFIATYFWDAFSCSPVIYHPFSTREQADVVMTKCLEVIGVRGGPYPFEFADHAFARIIGDEYDTTDWQGVEEHE